MTVQQHKVILEEILKDKLALNLIHSPKMKTYILGKVIEDLKRKHKEKTYHQAQPEEFKETSRGTSILLQ